MNWFPLAGALGLGLNKGLSDPGKELLYKSSQWRQMCCGRGCKSVVAMGKMLPRPLRGATIPGAALGTAFVEGGYGWSVAGKTALLENEGPEPRQQVHCIAALVRIKVGGLLICHLPRGPLQRRQPTRQSPGKPPSRDGGLATVKFCMIVIVTRAIVPAPCEAGMTQTSVSIS